ncbi:MAG TPA: hypothetical protein VJN88_04710 [Ktedonobacterales bacterium]|nr:hypothetical protein [Ktedonobacterales bacterium]
MASQRVRPIIVNDLLETIFTGEARALHASAARWCAVSPRFPAFLETYRDKIRKKLRNAPDAEGLRDLQMELLTAACLLTERAFTLDYEKYAASKVRGPDFTVLYKTHTPFNVEVKRLRGQAQAGKWADVLCDKLRQLPPSVMNALVIYGGPEERGAPFDASVAMASLRATAERKDDAYFTRRGLEGARDYLRQSLKLSAVVYRAGDAALAYWFNPQARHPLPAELRAALPRSLGAIALEGDTAHG